MSFKGTEYYRYLVDGGVLTDPSNPYGFRYKTDYDFKEAICALCDRVDKQAQVVEAARELISSLTGDKRYRDYLLEERCFQALEDAVDALEEAKSEHR